VPGRNRIIEKFLIVKSTLYKVFVFSNLRATSSPRFGNPN